MENCCKLIIRKQEIIFKKRLKYIYYWIFQVNPKKREIEEKFFNVIIYIQKQTMSLE